MYVVCQRKGFSSSPFTSLPSPQNSSQQISVDMVEIIPFSPWLLLVMAEFTAWAYQSLRIASEINLSRIACNRCATGFYICYFSAHSMALLCVILSRPWKLCSTSSLLETEIKIWPKSQRKPGFRNLMWPLCLPQPDFVPCHWTDIKHGWE